MPTKTQPHPEARAAGDPTPPVAQPLILNDAYFELQGVNLRCLVQHLEIGPENKPVTVTSFCAETDYPGVTKWHLRVTFYQSFDVGAVYDTLEAAYDAYVNTGVAVPFKARPYASRVPASNNPIISGMAIPQPFEILLGDAGAASQIQIDWNLTGAPEVDRGAVAVEGATAGAPGYFTPTGATIPADVGALAGVVATPATTWSTGLYVITADLLSAHWDGAAWAVGKAP
jgi:hypothetical protein